MEENKSCILYVQASCNCSKEIQSQQPFTNCCPGNLFTQILAFNKRILTRLNVKLWCTNKSRFLANESLDNRYSIVECKTHGKRQEQRESKDELHDSLVQLFFLIGRALNIGYVVDGNNGKQAGQEVGKEMLAEAHFIQFAQ